MTSSGGFGEGVLGYTSWEEGATLWVEVWADVVSAGWRSHVLVVRANDLGSLQVVNPHDRGRQLERFDDYDRVMGWMHEQEYRLIEGRWRDGFPSGPPGDEGDGSGAPMIEFGEEHPYPAWGQGETRWWEVWADVYGFHWAVALSVVRATSLGVYEVTSPSERSTLMVQTDDYDWLLEWMEDNQYRRIEGRWRVRPQSELYV